MMRQEYLERLAERRGRILQYSRQLVLTPAEPTRERSAQVETTWIDFNGFVGKPVLTAGETEPTRMYPNRITVHTVVDLADDVIVRFTNRDYLIDNKISDPEYGVGFIRYELTATLNKNG